MFIDFLMHAFARNRERDAIVWRDQVFSYGWLYDRINDWKDRLRAEGPEPGTVVILETDFSPESVALLLALVEHSCILVPLTSSVEAKKPHFIDIARGQTSFFIDAEDSVRMRSLPHQSDHELYAKLRQLNHPGLVLFSSGSTGESKASVQDLVALLEKFKVQRRSLRTITFLLYDHIGGFNTMFYTLSNVGCIVTIQDRNPDGVLAAVERHRVELLPTSPTFLNLMLISEAYKRHDISGLKTITYGTESMPESTLKRLNKLFPHINLLQTYGLSEVGILRSKSKSSDSLWVKIGGEGFQTRVVDGVLQIKAQSTMLGYLNAPSPFTKDGWFNTGDAVEVDGEYVRFLGRTSEIINVGGQKVYPAEVEDVIQQMAEVAEIAVYGEKNPITGNIVCCKVRTVREVDRREFVRRLKRYCAERLESYKVPVRVSVTDEKQYSDRFKKMRREMGE
jgi:acyl-coenzyme A synthetase/AMP-(fatty) acid ligase